MNSRADKKKIEFQRNRIQNKCDVLVYTLKQERLGKKLWHKEQLQAAWDIVGHLFGDEISEGKSMVSVIGQPGTGKTNLIHCIIYILKCVASDEKIITDGRLTITTGMSSRHFIDTVESGTRLRDTSTIPGSNPKEEKERIYHQPTFKYAIEKLKKNPELLSDHVFITDECHIAPDRGCTIEKQFAELGINMETIKKFNINS